MQHFEVVGCDCTCSNLHSIFCRSLSVYFYCYFISFSQEMEDPLLPKKITFGNYAVQRKSCLLWFPCSILSKKIFKFIQLTGFPFFVLLSVSVEPYLTIKATHFILPEKRRFLEEFLKCYNALWLHFKNTTLLFLLARKEIPYNLRHMWRLGMVCRVLIYHPWMVCGSLERKKRGFSHVTDFSSCTLMKWS